MTTIGAGQEAERTVAASSAGVKRSIWDGLFTEAQARRGAALYPSACGRCHGYKLNGAPDDPDMLPSPPIAGPKFLREWNGRTLAALYEYSRSTMPKSNPGFLSKQDYADLVAFMLEMSDVPAGSGELESGSADLETVEIHPRR